MKSYEASPAEVPVHIDPGFLTTDECRRIRSAMDAGSAEPAEVLGDEFNVEPGVRRASAMEVDAETLAMIEQKLDGAGPVLSQRFDVRLDAREGPSFLRYPDGGFYRPHRDRGVVASWPSAARRRVSLVLFLNSARTIDASGTFDGGALRIFFETADEAAVEIFPRAGTLVAFDATLLHEVTTVEGGMRDTVVDWFYD